MRIFLSLLVLLCVRCEVIALSTVTNLRVGNTFMVGVTNPPPPVTPPVTNWVVGFGGVGESSGMGVATDASSNVVVAGYFSGTASFGATNMTSAGARDIFVAKYTPTGTNLWAKQYGGTGNEQANGVALDSSGNIFVVGSFSNTVNFGTGVLTSSGQLDIFIAKLSSAGAGLWAVRYGSNFNDVANCVAVGLDDNPVIAGTFQGTNNFTGTNVTSTFSGVSSSTTPDTFVIKLDGTTGTYVWFKRPNNNSFCRAFGVAVDKNTNVVVTGSFEGSVDFLTANFSSFMTSAGVFDIYLVQLSRTNGSQIWAARYGSTDSEEGFAVTCDPVSGNPTMTGYFRATVNFGGGNLVSAGGDDIFLAQYASADGSYVWASRYGSFDTDRGQGVGTDASGNILLTGKFSDTVNFGGSNLSSGGTSGGHFGALNIFNAMYNSSGTHTWSEAYTGLQNSIGQASAIDLAGHGIATGNFNGSVLFKTTTLNVVNPSVFVIKTH